MEGLISPSGSGKTATRKLSSSSSIKDLWFLSRHGCLAELDSALSLLKKNGGSIDARNAFGLTPLHIATWRNHLPIVKRLLAAGADPDTRDGESGWSSLHRALHFGHLAIASVLLESGASVTLEDSKFRTPLDLLSGPVPQAVGNAPDSVATEVYSWGSGTNYQLGTGNAHIQKLPCKVDALQGSNVKKIAASKFHSVAVGSSGEIYTWGFGRGGRLGHPDFDIHSGQAAVITPRQVTLGLGSRRVKAIAAAKHHTVIATESGEVFTWGSNREGQLGYTSIDTQPTPRRVSSLRVKVISVAAANKHTAAVSESGEVFTWGCNKEGQLGYGTSNSASNYTPRMIEYLKGKTFRGVSASKYHTIALGADGEVFTWGHRLVTPRRVIVARSLKKSGSAPLKFHRMERLHVISVAAGVMHSIALTDDGALFYWMSSDPDLRCQQVYSMCGRNIVNISAGKYWTAAVTATGDVYMWDGKKCKAEIPIPTRLYGVKHATSVCIGETHLLVLSALYHPAYLSKLDAVHQKPILDDNDKLEEIDEDFLFNDVHIDVNPPVTQNTDVSNRAVPSLKSLCEKVTAEFLVEPKNAVQLLEIADSLEADDLRKHCEDIAIRNLDYIFAVSAPSIVSASPEILVKLEKLWDARSSEPWSYRRLPTATATFPAIIYSEEEGDNETGIRLRDSHKNLALKTCGNTKSDYFSERECSADQAVSKQIRALVKKLQQIEMLETKQLSGHLLDDQQLAKLQSRPALESALVELGVPLETESLLSLPSLADGKGSKKDEVSRKQRKKSKQKAARSDAIPTGYEVCAVENSTKGFPDVKILQNVKTKEDADADTIGRSGVMEDCSFHSPKVISSSNNNKPIQSTVSKKRNKKGGLSMFLSGALDHAPKNSPPPTPKIEGPAWGGTKVTKGLPSLRDIQNEQSKPKEITVIKTKGHSEDTVESIGSGQIRLSSLIPAVSSPIAVVPSRGVLASEGERSTPTWSSSGTSPVMRHTSLRDIQMQQEKKQQSLSNSPKTRTAGFSVASYQGLPSDSGGSKDAVPNRWFKPETDAPSTIRSIQIEEKAIKDLKRFYSSVKLVKPQPQAL